MDHRITQKKVSNEFNVCFERVRVEVTNQLIQIDGPSTPKRVYLTRTTLWQIQWIWRLSQIRSGVSSGRNGIQWSRLSDLWVKDEMSWIYLTDERDVDAAEGKDET